MKYIVQVTNKPNPSNADDSDDWREMAVYDRLPVAVRHSNAIEKNGGARFARVIGRPVEAALTLELA